MLPVRAYLAAGFRITGRCLSTQTTSGALIHEVTPRDGLQNEKIILSIDDKVELIRLIVASQPASIELTSFVRPDLVPAMADGEELVRRISNEYEEWITSMTDSLLMGNSVQHFMALLPNLRAYETFQKLRKQENCVLDTAVCLVRCVVPILGFIFRQRACFARPNSKWQWYFPRWAAAYSSTIYRAVIQQYICFRVSFHLNLHSWPRDTTFLLLQINHFLTRPSHVCICSNSCTDSHSMANLPRPLADALETTCNIIRAAKSDGKIRHARI